MLQLAGSGRHFLNCLADRVLLTYRQEVTKRLRTRRKKSQVIARGIIREAWACLRQLEGNVAVLLARVVNHLVPQHVH